MRLQYTLIKFVESIRKFELNLNTKTKQNDNNCKH